MSTTPKDDTPCLGCRGSVDVGVCPAVSLAESLHVMVTQDTWLPCVNAVRDDEQVDEENRKERDAERRQWCASLEKQIVEFQQKVDSVATGAASHSIHGHADIWDRNDAARFILGLAYLCAPEAFGTWWSQRRSANGGVNATMESLWNVVSTMGSLAGISIGDGAGDSFISRHIDAVVSEWQALVGSRDDTVMSSSPADACAVRWLAVRVKQPMLDSAADGIMDIAKDGLNSFAKSQKVEGARLARHAAEQLTVSQLRRSASRVTQALRSAIATEKEAACLAEAVNAAVALSVATTNMAEATEELATWLRVDVSTEADVLAKIDSDRRQAASQVAMSQFAGWPPVVAGGIGSGAVETPQKLDAVPINDGDWSLHAPHLLDDLCRQARYNANHEAQAAFLSGAAPLLLHLGVHAVPHTRAVLYTCADVVRTPRAPLQTVLTTLLALASVTWPRVRAHAPEFTQTTLAAVCTSLDSVEHAGIVKSASAVFQTLHQACEQDTTIPELLSTASKVQPLKPFLDDVLPLLTIVAGSAENSVLNETGVCPST